MSALTPALSRGEREWAGGGKPLPYGGAAEKSLALLD
jgi:hypothetical protein